MSRSPHRYAVYAVPGASASDGELAVKLRALGERALAGTRVARRYGWHATLKAPFRTGASETAVAAAVADLAARLAPAEIPALELRQLGNFWALTPGGDTDRVDALAAAVVTELDGLRLPLSPADLAKRDAASLSARQRELLDAWGYPYVLDEFRLHFTLSDPIHDPLAARAIGDTLSAEFAEVLGADLPLTAVALCVESSAGADFDLHSIHPLLGQETA